MWCHSVHWGTSEVILYANLLKINDLRIHKIRQFGKYIGKLKNKKNYYGNKCHKTLTNINMDLNKSMTLH